MVELKSITKFLQEKAELEEGKTNNALVIALEATVKTLKKQIENEDEKASKLSIKNIKQILADIEMKNVSEASKDMVIDIQPNWDANSDEDVIITCSSPEQAKNTANIIEDTGVSVDNIKRNQIFINGISTVSNQKELMKLEKYLKSQGYIIK